MPNLLPEFDRPPIDELALGVQFEPLRDFRTAHFGLYWSTVRSRYPHTEDQGPLPHTLETDGTAPPKITMIVAQGTMPTRAWFLDPSKTQLVQVQTDHFLRNWRRLDGTEVYPRFPALLASFMQEWGGFCTFLHDEGLGQAIVNQCELTYVNHLEPGTGWREFSDLPKAIRLFPEVLPTSSLPPPEMLASEARFKLPDIRGRMSIQAQPAFRGRDLKLIVALNIAARGVPSGSTAEELSAWFESAHIWAVKAFDESTDQAMHRLWEKRT